MEVKKSFQIVPREEVLTKYAEILCDYDPEIVLQSLDYFEKNADKSFPTLSEIKIQVGALQRSIHGNNFAEILAEKKMAGKNCHKCGNTGNWPYVHTDQSSWARRCDCSYGDQFPSWPTDFQLKQSFKHIKISH